MRYFLLIILPFFYAGTFAQVSAPKTSYDFGDVYSESQTYVDFVFTNTSAKTQYLLTIDRPEDVYYVFSSKKLLPDSSIIIRFKVNDSFKGKFSYQVDVYFSDPVDPITISLTGNIKEVASNPLTACPDFNSKPSTVNNMFSLVVKVIDSITQEPIPNAEVHLVERGELVGSFSTNQKGIVVKNVPIGYYYITGEKNPYYPNHYEGYVNASNNYVVIELSHTPPEPDYYYEPEIDTFVVAETVDPLVPVDEPEDPVIINNPPVNDTPDPIVIPPLTDIPDTLLDPNYFKYSNITFILDASSSMNSYGKLQLMKTCMIELIKMLRPEDNVTVLKYAAEVHLVLTHTSGDQKDHMITTINGIKTSGSTAGGDAIKNAYALNQEKHMHNGNNLIIMITDGVFNKGATDYDQTISSYYKEYGTRFTVVGIKTTEFVAQHMEAIVSKGGGQFIEIHTLEDAQTKLIEEIRRTSYKGKSE